MVVQVVVLIPAYDPGPSLVDLVQSLLDVGFDHIVVVDDGSRPDCSPIFVSLRRLPQCHVVAHEFNRGKGRSLKTGIEYILSTHPDYGGIVTADADGQHLARDVAKVAMRFARAPTALVLGTRRFRHQTPLKSLAGNLITRLLFRCLLGKAVSDTQTGLRCFSTSFARQLLQVEGERFDYETRVLAASIAAKVRIIEEDIETVYIDRNRSTHFRPLRDSYMIYKALLGEAVLRLIGR